LLSEVGIKLNAFAIVLQVAKAEQDKVMLAKVTRDNDLRLQQKAQAAKQAKLEEQRHNSTSLVLSTNDKTRLCLATHDNTCLSLTTHDKTILVLTMHANTSPVVFPRHPTPCSDLLGCWPGQAHC